VAPPRGGIQLAPDSGDLLLVAAGDSAALTRLVTRWCQPVYAFFERTREPSAAAEAALVTFERLVATSARYPPDLPFPSFLWRIASNVVQEGTAGGVLEIPGPKLAESAAARTALVRSAIAALPAAERAAFLLMRVARLPVAPAAEALGASETEIRRRLVRAFELLRESLAPLLEGAADSASRAAGAEAGAKAKGDGPPGAAS
jgi:DNA-directed RNA polymerase specialized sigma24 family protein